MNPSWRKNYVRYKSYFLNVFAQYKERADIKAYLEIILSLATVSIFSIFALRPTLLTIGELSKEVDSKKKTLQTLNIKIQNLSKAQSVYNQHKKEILLLNESLPDQPLPEIFVRQLEGLAIKHRTPPIRFTMEGMVLAGKSGQSAKAVKAKNKDVPKNLANIPLRVSVSAPLEQYTSIARLVEDIENMRRPIVIETLNLSSGVEDNKRIITLNISGETPYYNKSEKIE